MEFNPATIAADEFARRRATASRKVAAGELPAGQANALVLPWLAIACRAGATLPELAEDLTDIAEGGVITPPMARCVLADDICPLPRLREALANATAAAIRVHEGKPTPENFTRARGLIALARAFRAGPIPLSRSASVSPVHSAAQQPKGRPPARSEGRQAGSEESQAADAAPALEAGKQRTML